jgi:hypothetical protein
MVEQATVRHGDASCVILFSPSERRLELQIENSNLDRDAFKRAEAVLVGADGVLIHPARRAFADRFSLMIFEAVDPLASYRLEIDPALISRRA